MRSGCTAGLLLLLAGAALSLTLPQLLENDVAEKRKVREANPESFADYFKKLQLAQSELSKNASVGEEEIEKVFKNHGLETEDNDTTSEVPELSGTSTEVSIEKQVWRLSGDESDIPTEITNKQILDSIDKEPRELWETTTKASNKKIDRTTSSSTETLNTQVEGEIRTSIQANKQIKGGIISSEAVGKHTWLSSTESSEKQHFQSTLTESGSTLVQNNSEKEDPTTTTTIKSINMCTPASGACSQPLAPQISVSTDEPETSTEVDSTVAPSATAVWWGISRNSQPKQLKSTIARSVVNKIKTSRRRSHFD